MKRSDETEEEFRSRYKEAKRKGVCIWLDDADREFILDIIDDYIDICDAAWAYEKEQQSKIISVVAIKLW